MSDSLTPIYSSQFSRCSVYVFSKKKDRTQRSYVTGKASSDLALDMPSCHQAAAIDLLEVDLKEKSD